MSELAAEYLILWASQTGNAEWIAKNIHTEAGKKGYKGSCFVMDDFALVTLLKSPFFFHLKLISLSSCNIDSTSKGWHYYCCYL